MSDSKAINSNNVDMRTCQTTWTIDVTEMKCSESELSSEFSDNYGDNIVWFMKFVCCDCENVRLDEKWSIFVLTECEKADTIAGETEITLKIEDMDENDETLDLKRNFILTKDSLASETNRIVVSDFDISDIMKLNSESTITLQCVINFFKTTEEVSFLAPKPVPVPIPSPVCYPIQGFGKLYLNRKHSDVTLFINKITYPAHKVVLCARSQVFDKMFQHNMKENKSNRVEIEDINEEAFLEALRFMYDGKVENLDVLVYELLPIADRYGIDELKVLCGNTLRDVLCMETAVKILVLADSYNEKDLKQLAVEFIAAHSNNMVNIMSPEDWEELVLRPNLMKEVLILCMNRKH